MENLFSRMRNLLKLPEASELNGALSFFSKKEWIIFGIFGVVFLVSTLGILNTINKSFMVSVPLRGGEFSEGVVGSPRFINPILAFTPPDQDLTALIYSGLMRRAPNGTLIPDLAEGYEVSEDGLVYTFTLKNGLTFHDGEPLTTEDVLFTINAAKDPIIKSPKRGNWEAVAVESVDAKTITFTLKRTYASFLENTTLGIMPKHVWENAPIELNEANTNPIGSGPYLVSHANKQSSGIISFYELEKFNEFALGEAYIENINLYFYPSEKNLIEALESGVIDQLSSISPENALKLSAAGHRIESSVLPRVFGLFFNQNQNQIFLNKSVVRAIDQAIDKERIVSVVLGGYGTPIHDPIPPNMSAYEKLTLSGELTREQKLANARATLTKDGWKLNKEGILEKTITEKGKKSTVTLAFSISTGNAPELARSAELIKEDLEALGMKVDLKTFEVGNLNQSVIRPREYDALLFGQIINDESDLYAFWHSSQRKDPGLNVAMYTNAKVDKLLEDALVTINEVDRIKKYTQFEDEIRKDMPAVFLYSPNFIYSVLNGLEGLSLDYIVTPSDRFLSTHLWYTETDNVWKIFANN